MAAPLTGSTLMPTSGRYCMGPTKSIDKQLAITIGFRVLNRATTPEIEEEGS
jgi:hypothetical protein